MIWLRARNSKPVPTGFPGSVNRLRNRHDNTCYFDQTITASVVTLFLHGRPTDVTGRVVAIIIRIAIYAMRKGRAFSHIPVKRLKRNIPFRVNRDASSAVVWKFSPVNCAATSAHLDPGAVGGRSIHTVSRVLFSESHRAQRPIASATSGLAGKQIVFIYQLFYATIAAASPLKGILRSVQNGPFAKFIGVDHDYTPYHVTV